MSEIEVSGGKKFFINACRPSVVLNDFCFLNQLFFCVPKRKVAKEKGTSRGRLLSHDSNVATTRGKCCPLRRHHVFSAGEAVVHDGLKFRNSLITFN